MPICNKCGKDAHSDWHFGKQGIAICLSCENIWKKKNKEFHIKEFAEWVLGEKKDE